MDTKRILVVGGDPGSLGDHVFRRLVAVSYGKPWSVVRSSVRQRPGMMWLDLRNPIHIERVMETMAPTDIICCAGVNFNESGSLNPGLRDTLRQEVMDVNFHGPVRLMDYWMQSAIDFTNELHQFIAIGSNSSSIARSSSTTYCASKAALTMAMRCQARLHAGKGFAIYTYEPGWMDGTPMSERVSKWLEVEGIDQAHRIPGGHGVDPAKLAHIMVRNFITDPDFFNGCTLRLDGGEQ